MNKRGRRKGDRKEKDDQDEAAARNETTEIRRSGRRLRASCSEEQDNRLDATRKMPTEIRGLGEVLDD
jgi:hypothetical protein